MDQVPQSNQPIFKVPPPEPEKKSWFTLHHILGIVFLVMVLAAVGAGIYYWQTTREAPSNNQTPVLREENLVTIRRHGGLCVTAQECDKTDVIKVSGEYFHDGRKVMTLTTSQFTELKAEITKADFTVIKGKPFTGTCPIAFDGQEVIYTFYLSGKTEEIASCKVDIDENAKLFKLLNEIWEESVEVRTNLTVNSYASCIAAGNPMMKSKPPKCSADGVIYVEPVGACIQVIAYAWNPVNGEIRQFPTPCDIPEGWEQLKEYNTSQADLDPCNHFVGTEPKTGREYFFLDSNNIPKAWSTAVVNCMSPVD